MTRKYMVVKATPRNISGVQVEGKDMKFGKKNNAFLVNDPGLARDIEQSKGTRLTGDVVVFPVQQPEKGYKHSFVVPELPWKKDKKP